MAMDMDVRPSTPTSAYECQFQVFARVSAIETPMHVAAIRINSNHIITFSHVGIGPAMGILTYPFFMALPHLPLAGMSLAVSLMQWFVRTLARATMPKPFTYSRPVKHPKSYYIGYSMPHWTYFKEQRFILQKWLKVKAWALQKTPPKRDFCL
ncbi:MAG: hypothetical protein WC750_02790 [Patescibacteria group bacterium]|jgi:hypothetical protein